VDDDRGRVSGPGLHRVVVALDKFKGSVTAETASAAVARGISRVLPDVQVTCVPVADGGDGTLAVMERAGFVRRSVGTCDALGRPRRADIGLRADEAFVELAEICGIAMLGSETLRPLQATSRGVGMAIRAALDEGARTVVLGLGGSASTDGGLGLLVELGAVVRDVDGGTCSADGAGLLTVASLDVSGLDPRLAAVDVVAVTDVRSPLTGPQGAARQFGPQKGLTCDETLVIDRAMERWGRLLVGTAPDGRDAEAPGSGAAGGIAAAVGTVLNGTIRPGAAFVLDVLELDAALAGADLVIAGEGRWDAQTDQGKAPRGVVDRAIRAGVPVAIVAGRIDDPVALLDSTAILVRSLLDLQPDPLRSMTEAAALLDHVGEDLATTLAAGPLGAGATTKKESHA
jgi:glycerate kinase